MDLCESARIEYDGVLTEPGMIASRMLRLAAIVCMVFYVIPARADHDIVYSARCYYPADDGRMSHFHLYRINPDGSGRVQLTRGSYDDLEPQWSPNGQSVLFMRTGKKSELVEVLNINSGRVSRVWRCARSSK